MPARRDSFAWSAAEAPAALEAEVRAIEQDIGAALPEGYSSEISLRQPAWLGALAGVLGEGPLLHGTMAIRVVSTITPSVLPGRWPATTVTIGMPIRFLRRPAGHHAPGRFQCRGQGGRGGGPRCRCLHTQVYVPLAMGTPCRWKPIWRKIRGQSPGQIQGAAQLRRLLMPGEMGERFKPLALTRDFTRTMRDRAAKVLAGLSGTRRVSATKRARAAIQASSRA